MDRRLLLIAAAASLATGGSPVMVQAQAEPPTPEAPSAPIIIGTSWSLSSRILGDTRQINVWTPTVQASRDRRYTVLYVLDGALDQDFQHVAGLAQLGDLSWTFEPLIVVGVQTRNRRAELTPAASDARYITAFPEAGGAARFRRFLQEEVIPFVEARYPASGRRAIAGESLAGLFVIDTLLGAPQLFDDYFAISPSLWWDDGKLAHDTAARINNLDLSKERVWLAMADEGGTMQMAVNVFRNAASSAVAQPFDLQYDDRSAQETHATIYHAALLEGLRAFYGMPNEALQTQPWYMTPGGRPTSGPD
ncbi:alpha/beta hydrolase [Brevundimonas diminuta]|nr:alpha/beta hydrolase-fold protein [Brevundimonas diminuta]